MGKNVLGIDISDSSIEAAILDNWQNSFRLSAYSRFRLSPDIVRAGRILDQGRLKESIKKLLLNAKPKPINAKKVFLSVPESQTYVRIFSLSPDIPDKELRAVVLKKAGAIIGEDQDNLEIFIKPLSVVENKLEVLYIAVKKTIVDDLVKVFTDLGMEIDGIYPEAISSWVGLNSKFKNKHTLLFDVGARTSSLSIFSGGNIRDSLVINQAGDKLTDDIAQKFGISWSEAEEAKKNFGPDNKVMTVVADFFSLLIEELAKFIKYYEEKYHETIEQIIIIGGSAYLRDFAKVINQKLNRPALIGQSLLDNDSFPEPLVITKYINALGLASLAYKKTEFNLHRQSVKNDLAKKDYMARVVWGIIIFMLVGILLVATFSWFFKDTIARYFF